MLITSHHDVLEKKVSGKQTNRSQILNYGPARQARHAKKQVAIENSVR